MKQAMDRTRLYQTVARQLANRLVTELDGQIQSIVLYGSVARGQVRVNSDIDLLIVTPRGDNIRAKVAEIEEDLDSQNNYQTFLLSTYFTIEKVKELATTGSPHMLDVINEGVILYDDGCFSRVRQEILAGGRGDASRRQTNVRKQATQVRG